MKHIIFAMWVMGAVAGCGGSSSSPNTTSPSPPSGQNNDTLEPVISTPYVDFYTQANPSVKQTVSIVAAATSGTRLTQSSWQQLSGPSISSLTAHTQVFNFEPQLSGNYRFEYSGSNDLNQNVTEIIDIEVSESNIVSASIRLDHATVETAKVSLRVDGQLNKSISSIEWEQLAGPEVTDMTEQSHYLFFDAPAVAQDTVVSFKASIRYDDGSESNDVSYVLIMDTNINNDGYFPRYAEQIVSTDVKPYQPSSVYASELNECIYNNQIDASCFFRFLPVLGQQTSDPSINDILDRLLVSHPWMGHRFKQYLEQSAASADMLKLLRATTAIVISYDIRPSFYWSATGAIYLDGNNFWLTPEERDTLNDQPDFRSGFSNELQFRIPWRYVKNNRSYLSSSQYPVEQRLTRSFDDMEASITWLMYHELGHANDFIPPSSWATLNASSSPLLHVDENPPNSDSFSEIYPLDSTTMSNFAQVSFFGNEPNNEQKAIQPDQIATIFEPDNAPAYYSYSTIREDYATLFERFMMAYRLGVSADVAVTDDSQNLVISWGQRNRISEAKIKPRVINVVSQILPEIDAATAFSSLPNPVLMPIGSTWSNTLELTEQGLKTSAKNISLADTDQTWMHFQHKDIPLPPVNR